jgi:hypothetical protein
MDIFRQPPPHLKFGRPAGQNTAAPDFTWFLNAFNHPNQTKFDH